MRQHSGIGVLDKAVGVLHAVAESPCGLAELCDRTDLPRATAYRLAAALEVHRLLGRGQDGHWRLGPAITELATHVDDPLLVACAAVLPQLRDATGESVQVYRREGTSRVCVAALEPAAGLRDTVPVGARLPMTAGSGAKVLLAGCSMCLGMNPDQLASGERCAATSNRNFEGRQGAGGRTHLVSPAVAAATAVRGTLSSPADLN